MSMSEWAKREVEVACKREREGNGTKDGEFDYGCACYESALKAFLALMEDGHSNNSIYETKRVLFRLIDGKPLTPITDNEDEWNLVTEGKNNDNKTTYQSKRYSALFKNVDVAGNVTYRDINRFVCVDTNTNAHYSNGFINNIVSETVSPIKMPYYPSCKPNIIYTEDFLYDKNNGDFDTIKIESVLYEDELIPINRYFAEDGKEFKEISYEQYCSRKYHRIKNEPNEEKFTEYPYNKYKDFLDNYNWNSIIQKFIEHYTPNEYLYVSKTGFILYIHSKILDDFKLYCKDNGMTDDDYDLLFRKETETFWTDYLKDKFDLCSSTITGYDFLQIISAMKPFMSKEIDRNEEN